MAAAAASLTAQSRPVGSDEELVRVAALSANNDPAIGAAIAEAVARVGRSGVVTVEESAAYGLSVEYAEGLEFDNGWTSPYMVTDQSRMEAVLEDPYLLYCDTKITRVQELMPVLEQVTRTGCPLVALLWMSRAPRSACSSPTRRTARSVRSPCAPPASASGGSRNWRTWRHSPAAG